MCDDLQIRPVLDTDAPALAALLNEVIARGGTTALEQLFTPSADRVPPRGVGAVGKSPAGVTAESLA